MRSTAPGDPMPCRVCGAEIKWVEVEGEKLALDAIPAPGGKYRLIAEDAKGAEVIEPHKRHREYGYNRHQEVCAG